MVDGVPLLGGGGGQRVLVLSLAGVLLKIFVILEIVNLKLRLFIRYAFGVDD